MTPTTLCDCGHPPTPDAGCGTGYGRGHDGRTRCYACCADLEREALRRAAPGERISGYVSTDGRSWTGWPGYILGTVIRRGARHPLSRERYYLTVRDPYGGTWAGTGAEGMYATLRKTKG